MELRLFEISIWSSIALAIAVLEIAKAISLLHNVSSKVTSQKFYPISAMLGIILFIRLKNFSDLVPFEGFALVSAFCSLDNQLKLTTIPYQTFSHKISHIMLNDHFLKIIKKITSAQTVFEIEIIQSLWSGYGQIIRFGLTGSDLPSVIVKYINLDDRGQHPRGWNSNISHQRKLKSYKVEALWYQKWNKSCDTSCRVPQCLGYDDRGHEVLIVLEDLDAAGYPARKNVVSLIEMEVCLRWLAYFHATFMLQIPEGLWATGTYWHLDTRPDELQALNDIPLKNAAPKIDQLLKASPFQTFVHGDAKLANFCFSEDGQHVAAVDFQYVGGGCGMKDVAYFIGSCLNETQCEQYHKRLLDYYFKTLGEALTLKKPQLDINAIQQNWRTLYPVAWTDFHRFLKGWSPGHWKIHSYSECLAREVVASLMETNRDPIQK